MTNQRPHPSYKAALGEALLGNYNIGICAKIVNAQGKTLLIQRSAGDNYEDIWEIPGGGVDPGESLEQALAREVNEETGLTVEKIIRYIDYFDFHNIETGRSKRKFCFEVLVSGYPTISHEHSGFKWFSPDDIKQLRLQGEHENYQIWKQHYDIVTG